MRWFQIVLWVTGLCALMPVAGKAETPDKIPEIMTGPAPSWVKPIDPDSVTIPKTTAVENGIDYVLIDRQELMEPKTSFAHYTRRLINEHGLGDGAEIRDEFDPSDETFTMHWLKIKRDGVWQDRLATEKYQVLRREENLESQMLDGRYSVVYHLEDIRVGDEIDYAYTITGANPVFGGKLIYSFSTSWSSPVHLFSSQLLTAPSRTVSVKSFGPSIASTRTENPDHSELLAWKQEEVPAVFEDDDTPGWYDTYGWVQVSEYTSWKEVVDWGLATYPLDAKLSPKLQDKVNEIAKANTSNEDKALAVLAFVQNDIRYLGIEMGENSCKPTEPSLVFEHRFGDCKDKTTLCVTMLRALGIEAYPALVDTGYRQYIDHLLPSPLAFDHAIAQLIVDNKTYWIDLTRSGQRGRLKDFFISDFKQALVLKKDGDALTPMTISPESLPEEQVEDTFTVKSVKEPVNLQIHSLFKGHSAESTRAYFGESSIDKISKTYIDYYAKRYPKIKAGKPIRFQDFPEENRFEVWEEYSIPDLWTRDNPPTQWKAVFSPTIVYDAIGPPPTAERTAPYQLNYPTDISEDIEVHMFEDWNVSSKPNDVTTFYFTFYDHPSVKGNVVSFKFHYNTLVPDIPAASVTDFHDQIKKIRDNLDYRLTYTPKTDGPPPAPPPYRPNWTAFTIALLVFLFSCYVAVHIYLGKRPLPPLPRPSGLESYDGIGGWLILNLIGLFVRILQEVYALAVDHAVTWDATRWNLLTLPGGTGYDPLWAPALLFEMSFSILMLVLSVLSIVLMLQKRVIFPRVIIAFLVLMLIFKCIDTAIVNQIPYMVKLQDGKFDSDFVRVIVQSFIWIPYFIVSKRVKATFRF